ncbi:Inositol monophosphatase family protein [Sulfitobacter guttiformis KCTC 32187]|nr:inositol monophosphatase family protein [Sulfitobacter guttiformis]KIN71099.1 Inositol monophosphatase family protein [Sulfitobacter guttiformis KCTC 32187]
MLPDTASQTLQLMADVALRAGDVLLDYRTRRQTLRTEQKTAGDFVTDADRAAEALISAALGAAYPTYGWLGEEGGARGAQDGLRWVVDPLDGTTNYLKGLPHWAISIALYKGEEALCALVYDPAKAEMFVAERGHGAYLNGVAMQVSNSVPLDEALFATGVPAGGRITHLPDCLDDLERLMPQTAGIRRWGAAALDLAYVAAGRLEGYWERNLGAWDVAAGTLLVQEAGGVVTPLWSGRSVLSSGSFIATNAELAPALSGFIGTRE